MTESRAGRILDIFFPPRAVCAGCGELSGCEQSYLCANCLEALSEGRAGLVMNPLQSNLCGRAAAYRYDGPAGGVVRRLKYSCVRDLAPGMACDMVSVLDDQRVPEFQAAVPVPMDAYKRYLKSFNHAELLTERVCGLLGIPMLPDALYRNRIARSQARLSGEERRQNLIGAFTATEAVRGKSILLVDDVYTTGSTAEACAEALLRAGAVRVFLLTYAISPAHHQGSAL